MYLPEKFKRYVKSNKRLHHLALRAYRAAHPPPYLSPNMEFEADAWSGISSLYYHGGRQLGEDNSGPYPYREVTLNRYEICKFKDSRLGLPMNVTNLQLVMPFAEDAYRLTTALRNRYIAERAFSGCRLNLIQAYLLSKLSVSIPAFLVRRKENKIRDGEIEPLEAAFYMLGSAPFILVRQLMARASRAPLDMAPKSGDELYALSCDSRSLISTRERACPAAPKLIVKYYDVIMNGSFDGPLDSPSVDRVFERIADWNRLFEYTIAASRIDLHVLLNRAITLQFLNRLHGEAACLSNGLAGYVQTKLSGALALSCVEQPTGEEQRMTIEVATEVLGALLRDHGDTETLDELAEADVLSDKLPRLMSAHEVAMSILKANTVIHRSCQRDLQLIHSALGNRRPPSLRTEDMLRRTGGPALAEHLRWLDSISRSSVHVLQACPTAS